MSAGKSVLGILAGAAVGAAIGILYAPEKGEDTRKKISAKGREFSDNMEKKFKDLSNVVSEKLDAIKSEVRHRADKNGSAERSNIVNEMSSAGNTGSRGTV